MMCSTTLPKDSTKADALRLARTVERATGSPCFIVRLTVDDPWRVVDRRPSSGDSYSADGRMAYHR